MLFNQFNSVTMDEHQLIFNIEVHKRKVKELVRCVNLVVQMYKRIIYILHRYI